jgi:hypothetical protein
MVHSDFVNQIEELLDLQWCTYTSSVADRTSLKSGMVLSQSTKKVEPRTGHQINLRSGATYKKISTLMERTF